MHMQFNLVNFMVLCFFYACTKDYRTHGRPSLIRVTIYHYYNTRLTLLVLYLKLHRYLFIFLS